MPIQACCSFPSPHCCQLKPETKNAILVVALPIIMILSLAGGACAWLGYTPMWATIPSGLVFLTACIIAVKSCFSRDCDIEQQQYSKKLGGSGEVVKETFDICTPEGEPHTFSQLHLVNMPDVAIDIHPGYQKFQVEFETDSNLVEYFGKEAMATNTPNLLTFTLRENIQYTQFKCTFIVPSISYLTCKDSHVEVEQSKIDALTCTLSGSSTLKRLSVGALTLTTADEANFEGDAKTATITVKDTSKATIHVASRLIYEVGEEANLLLKSPRPKNMRGKGNVQDADSEPAE